MSLRSKVYGKRGCSYLVAVFWFSGGRTSVGSVDMGIVLFVFGLRV